MPAEFDVDDGLADLVDTLAGEASPDVAAGVRLRLDTDPAFGQQAAPIIAAWELDLRPRTLPQDAADARTAWAQVRSQVAVFGPLSAVQTPRSRSESTARTNPPRPHASCGDAEGSTRA